VPTEVIFLGKLLEVVGHRQEVELRPSLELAYSSRMEISQDESLRMNSSKGLAELSENYQQLSF